jgi:hypothetical protein
MSRFLRKEREILQTNSLRGVFTSVMNSKSQVIILASNLFMASIIHFSLLFLRHVRDLSSLNWNNWWEGLVNLNNWGRWIRLRGMTSPMLFYLSSMRVSFHLLLGLLILKLIWIASKEYRLLIVLSQILFWKIEKSTKILKVIKSDPSF